MKYEQTWDLERIFPGGTQSKQLQEKLKTVKNNLNTYEKLVHNWTFVNQEESLESFKELLKLKELINKGLGQCRTFVRMWLDAYMDDSHGNVVYAQVMDLYSEKTKTDNILTKKIVQIPEEQWQTFLQDDELMEISFGLQEIREKGKRLLSDAEEELLADLNKDGLSAWGKLYDTIVSTMEIPFTNEEGDKINLSVGQAMNRMYADPNPAIRKQLFENWEAEWEKYAPIFADNLNHLAGYRLTLQQKRGRKDHLEEPLEYNRMTKETLDAMWKAVSQNKQPFIDYLNRKAQLYEMNRLGWQDVDAPVIVGEREPKTYTYDEACDFILDNFSTFGEKLTKFTKHALENRWVEAEDRPNKRPGGYCTSLPEFNESRIFMTFTGSASDVSTLAHELGHAFHSYVMRDLPLMKRSYAMNVAETASTFAETIIDHAAIEQATTDEEKISLLASKLETATAMFLNIHARFIFEDNFYKERKEKFVSADRLNALMTEAQKEAYGDSLSTYHPHFWCSKLHFFIDSVPFYNFPYTFGYLFSLGIYAKYLENPTDFEEKYIALLRDTGSMKVEELAQKHLDVDLTTTQFWEAGIQLMIEDVNQFIKLTDPYIKNS